MMRGQWAENEVRKELAALEAAHLRFTFNRIPDAHGGFMQPAAADFQWFYDTGEVCGFPLTGPAGIEDQGKYTRNGVIEVKEVEHLTRLAHSNFSHDKIVRMHKRQLAGCESLVLIAFKLKGMRKPGVTWRAVPLNFFHQTTYVKGVGSWDLSEFPRVDMPLIIRGIVT